MRQKSSPWALFVRSESGSRESMLGQRRIPGTGKAFDLLFLRLPSELTRRWKRSLSVPISEFAMPVSGGCCTSSDFDLPLFRLPPDLLRHWKWSLSTDVCGTTLSLSKEDCSLSRGSSTRTRGFSCSRPDAPDTDTDLER
jgi:hypothetical protein